MRRRLNGARRGTGRGARSMAALSAAVLVATGMGTTTSLPSTAPAAGAAPALGSTAPVPQPWDDDFYRYRGATALAQQPNGTPLAQRTTQVHLAGIPTPLRAEQVLYRTTDAAGRAHATATSVIVPPQANGRVVSYQSAYDSLAADCQPSYALAGGADRGYIATGENGMLTLLATAGYTIITSDFEGQDPHFAHGVTYGRGVLDGIRAAGLARDTGVTPDSPVVLAGYSGGAIGTQWAAELAPDYAPDVDARILGAAAGGLLVEPLRNLDYVDGTPLWKAVIPMAVSGIARAHGVDITPYLSERGRQVFARAERSCIVGAFADSVALDHGLTWADLVLPEDRDPRDLPILQELGDLVVMGTHGTPSAPLLLRQGGAGWIEGTPGDRPGIGAGDGVMIMADGRALARDYCTRGVTVDYADYPHLSHTLGAVAFAAEAVPWIDARFAGAPAPTTCGRL